MRVGTFLRALGALLLLWGVGSWFIPLDVGVPFFTDGGQRALYLTLGLAILWSSVTWNPDARHTWARILGVVLVLLALVGWVVSGRDASNLGVMHLDNPSDNLLHLALGVAALWASKWARSDEIYSEPAGTTMNLR